MIIQRTHTHTHRRMHATIRMDLDIFETTSKWQKFLRIVELFSFITNSFIFIWHIDTFCIGIQQKRREKKKERKNHKYGTHTERQNRNVEKYV